MIIADEIDKEIKKLFVTNRYLVSIVIFLSLTSFITNNLIASFAWCVSDYVLHRVVLYFFPSPFLLQREALTYVHNHDPTPHPPPAARPKNTHLK